MKIVSVFWSSGKLFAAFLLRSVALVVHLQVFLIELFALIPLFCMDESTMAFLWYLCGLGKALPIISCI